MTRNEITTSADIEAIRNAALEQIEINLRMERSIHDLVKSLEESIIIIKGF